MHFRENKVWLATDRNGKPIIKDGKVLIKYRLDHDYEYWVNPNMIKPIDPKKKETSQKSSKKHSILSEQEIDPAINKTICDNAICLYTDGASSGNPGPSGIGVLLRFGKHEKEISRYIGIATNNIAELEAIRVGLLEVKKTDLPVRIFTDSNYAYGVLVLNWKARRNIDLINSIKEAILKFDDLKFVKIKGHAGIEGNERANLLATSAIKKADLLR